MENSGDNISFDDVLGTENSGWELLDDTGAMGFVRKRIKIKHTL